MEGCLCYEFGGLLHGGTYFWKYFMVYSRQMQIFSGQFV